MRTLGLTPRFAAHSACISSVILYLRLACHQAAVGSVSSPDFRSLLASFSTRASFRSANFLDILSPSFVCLPALIVRVIPAAMGVPTQERGSMARSPVRPAPTVIAALRWGIVATALVKGIEVSGLRAASSNCQLMYSI